MLRGVLPRHPHLHHLVHAGRRDREVAVLEALDEAAAEWPDATIGVHHRVGRVDIGEASIVIVAVSAHRAAAFAACRYVIERVKQIAPVWKHEHFEGGDVWIEGATAQPDDEGAREEARRRACA